MSSIDDETEAIAAAVSVARVVVCDAVTTTATTAAATAEKTRIKRIAVIAVFNFFWTPNSKSLQPQ